MRASVLVGYDIDAGAGAACPGVCLFEARPAPKRAAGELNRAIETATADFDWEKEAPVAA
jgi:hypothetical protein